MTKHEYYELLCTCAVDGMFPSMNDDTGACKYRASRGRKCAVGVLIPDELYDKAFENLPVGELPRVVLEAIVPEGMVVEDLYQVQSCHDNMNSFWDSKLFIARLDDLSCFSEEGKHDKA